MVKFYATLTEGGTFGVSGHNFVKDIPQEIPEDLYKYLKRYPFFSLKEISDGAEEPQPAKAEPVGGPIEVKDLASVNKEYEKKAKTTTKLAPKKTSTVKEG